jgi:uncharacterized iron-regulated membrane protein
MKEGFRQSMAWLHTWSGLLVGWVLFLVFVAGTASYFRDEITLWMKPELHQAQHPDVPPEVAAGHAVALLQQRAADSPRWFITMPTEREPGVRVSWANPPGVKPKNGRGRFSSAMLDPATGAEISEARETRGGEFFYRLHFDLHYMPAIWARWIVGVCAMFMLVAILSGIVTHRRIFKDFFTFRPKKGQRSWLDAHNATAVLALPFHLMITYTGLLTLMFMYFPAGVQAVYKGDQETFFAEMFPSGGDRNAKPSGEAAPLAAVGPMVAEARAHWGGAPVGRITVNNPNDARATVAITRQIGQATPSMSYNTPTVIFDGPSGRQSKTIGDEPSGAAETRGVLYGLHIARFSSPFLRGLFFLSGIAGCLMVATGVLLWAVKERQKYAKAIAKGGRAGFGVRLVDGLNVAAIGGLPIAFAAYFWANRLLPVGLEARADVEIRWFFIAWAVAAVAGLAWPTRRLWQLLLTVGGTLLATIPLLNAATTATHLGVMLPSGQWAVAGFDLVVCALGLSLLWAAWFVGRRAAKKAAAPRPGPAVGGEMAEGVR